jgi:hypothetical protein
MRAKIHGPASTSTGGPGCQLRGGTMGPEGIRLRADWAEGSKVPKHGCELPTSKQEIRARGPEVVLFGSSWSPRTCKQTKPTYLLRQYHIVPQIHKTPRLVSASAPGKPNDPSVFFLVTQQCCSKAGKRQQSNDGQARESGVRRRGIDLSGCLSVCLSVCAPVRE